MKVAVATLCFALSAIATVRTQNWGVTANAPYPGQCTAQVYVTNVQWGNLVAGPVPTGTFLQASTNVGISSAAVSASWSEGVPGQTAPLAFTARVDSTCIPGGTWSAATLGAALDVTMQTPNPVGGRLLVRYITQGGLDAQITMDAGADGSIDFVPMLQGVTDILDVPIAAGVTQLRLHYSLSSSTGSIGGTTNASCNLEVQFFPNEPAVHLWDQTGATETLLVSHPEGDDVTLSLPTSAGQTPLLYALGVQPMVQPLLPTVTQLVSLDVVIAAPSVTFSLPQLPVGTAFYGQGVTINNGLLRASQSVRAIWN